MQLFFDRQLEREFKNVYSKFKQIQKDTDSDYQFDLDRMKRLLVTFDPLPTVCDKDGFNVAAIDGSGADTLLSLNDIAIHLVTASFAADRVKFREGTTKQLKLDLPVCTSPEGILRLILVRPDKEDEMWEEFADFILANYGEDFKEVIRRVIYDLISIKYKKVLKTNSVPPVASDQDIINLAKQAHFKLLSEHFDKYTKWLLTVGANQSRGWYDQFRETLEYSLANALLNSDTHFKYLFLDGSMNMFMRPDQDQPRLAPNYLLRDLAIKSLRKGTCLAAVSKTTSFPFAYRIAQDIENDLGGEKKWFLRIPTRIQGSTPLKILENRPHIPPRYGVSYLFHFSSEVPLLRIDFDINWWNKHIKSATVQDTINKEIELFQEIDWLSREVRYFGYFFDLAFAHNETIVRFPERDQIAEMLIDYFVEQGEDYRMFVHPRRRLGLM